LCNGKTVTGRADNLLGLNEFKPCGGPRHWHNRKRRKNAKHAAEPK
jgi:hypothetical protein